MQFFRDCIQLLLAAGIHFINTKVVWFLSWLAENFRNSRVAAKVKMI